MPMIGYLDIPSGLSGDMFLGCLVDAGWDVAALRSSIEKLDVPRADWDIEATTVMKGPLRATRLDVRTVTGTTHRHLDDIRRIIDASRLDEPIRARAVAVFGRLAEAEAKVHGTTPQKIHFHEVGALDAIIDIVGAVCGLAALGIDTLHAAAPPLGEGWVDTAHGRIPLPAPATLELLARAGAPTRPAPGPGEWLTPTGAALLAELACFRQPAMHLERIGTGAGQRDCAWPNVARLWVGRPAGRGPVVQIDTNIDDMNPQLYASVTERLLAAGALDAWLTPVQMKKGRPAVVLSVLAPAGLETVLADMLLSETTTFGVRIHEVRRHEARREMQTVSTPYGSVEVKLKWVGDRLVGASPEYEACRARAQEADEPLRVVYDAAQAAARGLVKKMNATENE